MTDTTMIDRLKQFVESEMRSCSMDKLLVHGSGLMVQGFVLHNLRWYSYEWWRFRIWSWTQKQ